MFKNLIYIIVALGVLGCTKGDPPSIMSFEPEFGPPETLITVKGVNFDDMLALNFDDNVPADFNPSFGTETALLFRVPKEAILGDNMIRVVTVDGETSFPFKVTQKAPEITSFGPSSASAGDKVFFSGENFFEPLEILFFDSIPGTVLFATEDSLVVEVPEGVQKGRIKVKANGGFIETSEVFFTTKNIVVNDFDGNGVRSETENWLFYGNIDQNSSDAVHSTNPEPLDGNFLKITGVDPGSIWIGGAESNSNDLNNFDVFDIQSDINNTFIEMDLHSNGAEETHLIVVLAERGGSFNDFTETVHIDWDGWEKVNIPLNRFVDFEGATIDPSKIRTIKLHLYNELGVSKRLQANIDNLQFIQIN